MSGDVRSLFSNCRTAACCCRKTAETGSGESPTANRNGLEPAVSPTPFWRTGRLAGAAALLFPLAILTAAPAPFSHKLHLKQGLECVSCHTGAAASTKATDNLLPSKEICSKCHESAAVPPPRPHKVQKFNHALHLKMGNIAPVIARAIDSGTYLGGVSAGLRAGLNTSNACQACHRGMEESEVVTAAAMPRMSDCLVCHNRIEPPASCEKCHLQVENLKPATHTADWVDLHTEQKLDKQTCEVCHGRKFTCQGCH